MDQASEKNKVFWTFKDVAHVLNTVITRYFLLKNNPRNHLFPSFLKPDHIHNSSNYATHLPISMKINITYLLVLLWNIHHNPLVNMIFYEQYRNHPLIKNIVTCLFNAHHYNWGNTKFKVFEFKIPVHVLLFSLILWLPYLLSLVLCQFDLPLPVTIWIL